MWPPAWRGASSGFNVSRESISSPRAVRRVSACVGILGDVPPPRPSFEAVTGPARDRLIALHGDDMFRGVIDREMAVTLADELRLSIPGLMALLLPAAAAYARPPVSGFHVGAVARGTSSGDLYYGANLEFEGESLSFALHAEQSAIANAWMAGEDGIDILAVTAPPCGHCRQFLNELTTASSLSIEIPSGRRSLRELLPDSFGPGDLQAEARLMGKNEHSLDAEASDELVEAALVAARRSHAPYSGSFAGVALRSSSGQIASGAYGENAAFNPSLAPVIAALSQLNLAGESFDAVTDAVLVHVDSRHSTETRAVLASACDAPLRSIRARNSR
jgi:cytidine deaminase